MRNMMINYKELKQILKDKKEELQLRFIMDALNETNGNIAKASRLVGMDRRNFDRLMIKLGFPRNYFRGMPQLCDCGEFLIEENHNCTYIPF